jgi:hypothetical protein
MNNQSIETNFTNILEILIRDGATKNNTNGLMIVKLPQYMTINEEEIGEWIGKVTALAIDISFKTAALNFVLGGTTQEYVGMLRGI